MTIPRATITRDVTNQVDGSTAAFTTSPDVFAPGTLVVHWNGLRQRPGVGNDYVETSDTNFTMALAPRIGDHVLVQFEDAGAFYPLVEAESVPDF